MDKTLREMCNETNVTRRAVQGYEKLGLVFASGKNEVIENEIHTNFKLSSSKEVVALTSKEGKLLSKIHYEETVNDSTSGVKKNAANISALQTAVNIINNTTIYSC